MPGHPGRPPGGRRTRRSRRTRRVAPVAAVAAAAALTLVATSPSAPTALAAPTGLVTDHTGGGHETGDMIFIHPDGTDAALWEVTRDYWYGPDAVMAFDRLPVVVPYRGHALDDRTTSSNGGATAHAFGYKVDAPDSFGTDTGAEDVLAGDAEEFRRIDALSGYPGSWLREAGNAGHPIGVVNDGDVAEPGTAAFLTEVGERTDASALEIARQLIEGRPGFDDADAAPAVIMGGGEDLFFPEGTPICSADQLEGTEEGPAGIATAPTDCVVHREPGATLGSEPPSPTGGLRTDGVNLAQRAVEEGYTLVRTRDEFSALAGAVDDGDVDPADLKVLGLFAPQDIFNAETEEDLVAAGLVDESVPADAKESRLVLYGSEPGTPGYQPPRAPEMAELATTVLDAHSDRTGLPFGTVWEVEGTDNMANSNNAIGTLTEARDGNEMIGVARDHLAENADTTIVTAADGDAGGLRSFTYDLDEGAPATVESTDLNPARTEDEAGTEVPAPQNPLDGIQGQGTAPFRTAPDQFGQELPFAVAWVGLADVTGGVVTRSEGLAADDVDALSARFDNVDVYRIAYRTLFGTPLTYPVGENAPTRDGDVEPDALAPGEPSSGRATDELAVAEEFTGEHGG